MADSKIQGLEAEKHINEQENSGISAQDIIEIMAVPEENILIDKINLQ